MGRRDVERGSSGARTSRGYRRRVGCAPNPGRCRGWCCSRLGELVMPLLLLGLGLVLALALTQKAHSPAGAQVSASSTTLNPGLPPTLQTAVVEYLRRDVNPAELDSMAASFASRGLSNHRIGAPGEGDAASSARPRRAEAARSVNARGRSLPGCQSLEHRARSGCPRTDGSDPRRERVPGDGDRASPVRRAPSSAGARASSADGTVPADPLGLAVVTVAVRLRDAAARSVDPRRWGHSAARPKRLSVLATSFNPPSGLVGGAHGAAFHGARTDPIVTGRACGVDCVDFPEAPNIGACDGFQ